METRAHTNELPTRPLPTRSLPTRLTSKRSLSAGSLAVSLLLLLLPIVLRLDGKPHADWQQFLGRFHPLVVHLPIGLLLLVPVLELAGKYRPALHEAAAFVLSLSVMGCLAALSLGYLLAHGSGEAGSGVARHMWGGIALTIAVMACALLRAAPSGQRRFYPAMLCGVLLLLAWTAHQGGALTHGKNALQQAGDAFWCADLDHLVHAAPVYAEIQ